MHPYDELLRQQAAHANPANGTSSNTNSGKLRSIPVRMLFDDPSLNLRAEYSLFDRQTGRPLCVGNGESCKRITDSGIQRLPCPSPSLCDYAAQGHCKPYGRLHVRIEPSGQSVQTPTDHDELGTFIFRTTGFNSIRTLAARLSYFQAYSGGLLSCLPLQLKLRGKSTTQSHRTPIFYVDLCLRDGVSMAEAMQQAREQFDQRQAIGLQQSQLEDAAREGFGNAEFENSLEELPEVLEELYPELTPDWQPVALPEQGQSASSPHAQAVVNPSSLAQKLTQRQRISQATSRSAAQHSAQEGMNHSTATPTRSASPRFPLGQVMITLAAQALLDQAGITPQSLLIRHHHGDWGDVCFDDACANNHALESSGRLFSAYKVGQDKVWIITEADRLYTTLLMPEDY